MLAGFSGFQLHDGFIQGEPFRSSMTIDVSQVPANPLLLFMDIGVKEPVWSLEHAPPVPEGTRINWEVDYSVMRSEGAFIHWHSCTVLADCRLNRGARVISVRDFATALNQDDQNTKPRIVYVAQMDMLRVGDRSGGF